VASTVPHSNLNEDFIVFPSKLSYTRPDSVSARHVTPTKLSGAQSPPSAHYLAIVEATVSLKWTRSSSRPGLFVRLEERLRLTLVRARSESVPNVITITDLVAVVGVAAPLEYTESVCDIMSGSSANNAQGTYGRRKICVF
jgi:hypothetical protein